MITMRWLVVRDSLTAWGFNARDASVLAGAVKGCPRVRIEKLIEQRHIMPDTFPAPRKRHQNTPTVTDLEQFRLIPSTG